MLVIHDLYARLDIRYTYYIKMTGFISNNYIFKYLKNEK